MAEPLSFDELNRLGRPTVTIRRSLPEDPFSRADAALRTYERRVSRAFSRMRSRLSVAPDLYAMLEIVYGTYSTMRSDYVDCLGICWRRGYSAMTGADPGAQRASGAVSAFMSSYAMPERYVPDSEWQRKRARAGESIVAASGLSRGAASPDRGAVGEAVETSKRAWGTQLRQGSDDMAAAGMLAALMDAGTERVVYKTARDERVCGVCSPRDGKVYDISEAPSLPEHYRCRCYYVPYQA